VLLLYNRSLREYAEDHDMQEQFARLKLRAKTWLLSGIITIKMLLHLESILNKLG